MGMYDNLRCEYPLPGDPGDIEFQTKDFDSILNEYRITVDGKLLIEEYDIEDRSDPNATGFMRFVGSMTRIPKGYKPVDFTGYVNFYGKGFERPALETDWFEYIATFEHGMLTSVERLTAWTPLPKHQPSM